MRLFLNQLKLNLFPTFKKNGQHELNDDREIANTFNAFFINVGPDQTRIIRYNGYKTHHTYLTQNNDIELNFTDVFPSQLKIAKVIPTFKKDDNKIFNNYRPISLLPALSKVVEKVICSQINNFFITNNLFYDSQYGLRPGHYTEYAAIEITDRIITDMDTNKIPLNIYLDLSQAFDTLDHAILLDKLSHYGIRGNPLKLISSYLENRQQFVEFRNTKSSILQISTGVPQGSILGPLLFLIYINYFPSASSYFNFIM